MQRLLVTRQSKRRAGRRSAKPQESPGGRTRSRSVLSFIDQTNPGRPVKVILLVFLAALLPALVQAQNRDANTTILLTGPNFFISLIAGLILAVAFQLILTNLSIAAGLNALGPFGETRKKVRTSESDRREHRDRDEVRNADTGPGVMGGVRRVSSAFGLWSLVTASLALFFATWLAVTLSFTPDALTGAVLGLVIWGLFYITMMVVEANLLSSLVGSLMRIATGGLRAAYRMTTSVFGKSDDDRIAETAAKITGAVKEELFGDFDDVKDQIQKYVKQLKPAELDADQIRDEIVKLLDETEIHAISKPNSQLDEETVLRFVHQGTFNKEQVQTIYRGVRGAFQKVRDETRSDKDNVAKVVDAALRVAGIPAEEATRYRQRVEEYLRSTGREELDPDAIKRELEVLFRDPRTGKDALGDRLAKLDRNSVTALLAQREGMSQEQADKYVGRVYGVIDRVRNRLRGNGGYSESGDSETIRMRATNKISDYLNSLNVPSLNYDNVSQDFERMFHGELRQGASDFISRLKSLSREDLRTMIAARRDIPPEEAERLINRIENARDSVIERYNRTISEVKRRTQAAKTEALHQAEETRKTAAVAAWWVLGAAVVSGVAAVLGGILGAVNDGGLR